MTTNNLDLSGLIKFLGRDDWAFHFEEVMANIWPVMDEFQLDHEGIVEAIADHWGIYPVDQRIRRFPRLSTRTDRRLSTPISSATGGKKAHEPKLT